MLDVSDLLSFYVECARLQLERQGLRMRSWRLEGSTLYVDAEAEIHKVVVEGVVAL